MKPTSARSRFNWVVLSSVALLLFALALFASERDAAFASPGKGVARIATNGAYSAAFSRPQATDTPSVTGTPPTDIPTDTATVTATPGGQTTTPTVTNTPLPLTDTPSPTITGTPPTATPTPTDRPNVFVDIIGNVFYGAIHYLNCRGVTNGVDATHYGPAGTSTRGQFAKTVVSAWLCTTTIHPNWWAIVHRRAAELLRICVYRNWLCQWGAERLRRSELHQPRRNLPLLSP